MIFILSVILTVILFKKIIMPIVKGMAEGQAEDMTKKSSDYDEDSFVYSGSSTDIFSTDWWD